MKTPLILVCTLLLGACAGSPVVQSSFNGYGWASSAPTSANDPRLLKPQFYMDDDSTPRWLKAVPQTNR
jgi:hypothetical protein